MKNQLLILSMFVFTTGLLNAQDTAYKPMVLEGAHWFMNRDICDYTPWIDYFYAYVIKGDTIINDTIYKKTYRYDFAVDDIDKSPLFPYQVTFKKLCALLREDVVDRKVWVRLVDNFLAEQFYSYCSETGNYPSDVNISSSEMLLYDFSLNTGDTLDWCYTYQMRHIWEDDILQPIIIDSVTTSYPDSYCFDGEGRRSLHIFGFLLVPCGLQPAIEGSIVEGIGLSEDGLFFGSDYFCGYCLGSDLECDILTSTKELERENDFSIYPNPSNGTLNITIPKGLKMPKLEIYTMTGQLIKQFSADSSNTISDLPNGIYLVQVLAENQVVKTEKIYLQK